MVTFDRLLDVVPILSLVIVFTYYSLQIRNQNITRRTQLYMQLFLKEASEEFQSLIYDFNHIRTDNVEEIRTKMLDDKEFAIRFRTIVRFFDGVGEMIKAGLLDPEMIHHFGSGIGVLWSWKAVEPYALDHRKRLNTPDYMEGFEFYYSEILKLRKQKGLPYEWSEEQNKWI